MKFTSEASSIGAYMKHGRYCGQIWAFKQMFWPAMLFKSERVVRAKARSLKRQYVPFGDTEGQYSYLIEVH